MADSPTIFFYTVIYAAAFCVAPMLVCCVWRRRLCVHIDPDYKQKRSKLSLRKAPVSSRKLKPNPSHRLPAVIVSATRLPAHA